MDGNQEAAAKANRFSTSLYPVHSALIKEIRLKRGKDTEDIPGAADVVQEAIVFLARHELDPDRFNELMAFAS